LAVCTSYAPRELDAGLGVEMSPEDVMAEIFVELGISPG
jgi:hypothetical protein